MGAFCIKLGSIAAVFGEFEADAMLSVELSTVNALLAGAYVEVMLSQVQQCDLADFLRQRVILRGRDSLVASRCFFRERLRAFVVGGREKSKHHLQQNYYKPAYLQSVATNNNMQQDRVFPLYLDIPLIGGIVFSIIQVMSVRANTLQPPIRSDLSDPFRNTTLKSLKASESDPFRNTTLKSLKASEYESKIQELSNQVRLLRDRLMEMEQSKNSEMPNDPLIEKNMELQRYVALLRDDNDALRKENMQLRQRVRALEGRRKGHNNNQNRQKAELASVKSLRSLQYSPRGRTSEIQVQGPTNKNSMHLSSGTSVTTNLMRQLLAQCNEPNECLGARQRQAEKDEFYQFKNTEDCFEPFFSALPKELKIRLKRCLIKQKQLLLVDNNIELGVISPYKVALSERGQNTRLVMVITNIGLHPITDISLEYIYSNDVSLFGRQGHSPKGITRFNQQLKNNQQVKEQMQVTANNIDFQCVKVTISYKVAKVTQSHLLILPLSKGKLFRELPFTSTPKHAQRVQRVFQYQRKILSEVGKLKNFFGNVYEGREQNGSPRYCWKVQFMGRQFWLQAHQLEQKLALCVTYQSERVLAQKILGEYVFLLQKI